MRLKILLPPESSNISYSYGVLYRFQTPFRTFSHLIPPNTRGEAGSRISLGSIDKKLRLKAPTCLAGILQVKGSCFGVTALPTGPSMSQDVSPQFSSRTQVSRPSS